MYEDSPLRKITWEQFQSLENEDKGQYFLRNGSPYHALIAQQFDRPMLERLCDITTRIRGISKTRKGAGFLKTLLSDKRAMMYFVQPSSRTFLSFYAACQVVGMQAAEVRNTTTSSEVKGESPEDTIRTFSSYFDAIIMRHPVGGFAERVAWLLSNTDRSVPVINAGSGKDQHPTQALLDIYTLQRSFEKIGGIDGKSVAFVGDLARGRTVRSLSRLLSLYKDVKLYFVAPASLQIGEDILEALKQHDTAFEVTSDFERVIPEVNAIYMTRIQDEWDKGVENAVTHADNFHFTADHLNVLRKDAVIMHPLPRRGEIAPEVDADPRAMYWRQVRNGMWMRVALLLTVFERDRELDTYREEVAEKVPQY